MSHLLSAHFEQIAISCQGIDSLPFPQPKIFTNALLSNHDITSLIRDTEAHERALFSVPPPPPPVTALIPDPAEQPKSSRRQTVFNVASGEVTTSGTASGRLAGGPAPRRHTAVTAVLGGALHDQIRRSERRPGGEKGDVDVEVLLRGAEKLCGVYPLPGALERIPSQRSKHANIRSTLAYYENKVAEQAEELARLNKDHWLDDEDEDIAAASEVEGEILTEEDLRREEEEVRELDKKKRELQERLRAMEKDLGGLLHM
ncbi:DASH complex subunit Spc34 [Microdochium trichocladiopsis]|uniref:DASH complex subunit SPC34 n=1 Tax=Microdochium trichocladiopsis TaxID=1682393 RepID=A0A9P9BPG2_9PEZI|nr:DASH complex subunit Spc34 [Microdochium trichocladiopsis]KAH7029229.1 DASH complex subunit Spc34 [Microdochium trichocladiopsis]